MGTRMAPSYASLFWTLVTCNHYCGYVFWMMIWDDSEEQLLRFLDKLIQRHETIQFTYSYLKQMLFFFSGCETRKI